MPTRRSFLKLTGATTIAWYVATQTGWTQRAIAQIPGGTLNPNSLTKYVTPMLIPAGYAPGGDDHHAGRETGRLLRDLDEAVRPADPARRHADDDRVGVWGRHRASSRGLLLHNAPSLTIETTWKRPVRIKWINDLKDANGNYLPHLLPVDQTLHWANPPGGTAARDTRPTFDTTPGPYTGPVPIVTHLHGAAGVGDESDGYAEAWYLPAAGNIPAGYATEGTWHDSSRASQRRSSPSRGGRGSRPSSTPTTSASRRCGTTTTPWA